MPSLNTQILVASLLGILVGLGLHPLADQEPLRQHSLYWASLVAGLFVGLLKMLVIPLVFTSVCVGVARLGELQQASRIWRLTLGFFVSTMLIAMLLALAASHWVEPGKGLSLAMFASLTQEHKAQSIGFGGFVQQLLSGLFVNPFAALAEGKILAILVFALLLGAAMARAGDAAKPLLAPLESLLHLIMLILHWAMRLAPLGIFALLVKLVATQQHALLSTLAEFILLVITTTLVHGLLVLPALLWLLTRYSPWRFFQGAKTALITAFATSSSSATLPVTLNCTQTLGVRPSIGRFVVPLGATLNMDGTALYEAAAALFVANLAGIELGFAQQCVVLITAMIAAMGAPGIPSAGMVTMIMVLQSVGLPVEAIAILLPIDRLLDTVRTAVNVQGDMVAAIVVDHYTPDTEKHTAE
jgi:Na+/H+-dicarboxylate symporter